MTHPLVPRLVLDLIAGGLLLAGLAYWWQGNTVHEVIGTSMFALLFAHNIFNRSWWGTMARAPREPRRLIDASLTLPLLVVMVALLATSLAISRTVFSFLPLDAGFTARQVHAAAGYWSLVLVSLHLGLRWQRVMNVMRIACRFTNASRMRTAVLRVVALAVAIRGACVLQLMGVLDKLSVQLSPDGWDFESSTAAFFVNWACISGLVIAMTHYAMKTIAYLPRISGKTKEST